MSAFVHHATVRAHGHPVRFSIGSLIVLGGALAVLARLGDGLTPWPRR